MIITFCRYGKSGCNTKLKGAFKKSFKNLADLARFMYKSRKSLFTPFLEEELTFKQRKILSKKFIAIWDSSSAGRAQA